jgi:hypothetical protein
MILGVATSSIEVVKEDQQRQASQQMISSQQARLPITFMSRDSARTGYRNKRAVPRPCCSYSGVVLW